MPSVNKLPRANVPNRTTRPIRPETTGLAPADRRVTRTQRSLHEAFIGLVLEKGFDAITIKEIAARADVGRSTLYAHHGGKAGLLRDGLQNLRAFLLAQQREALALPRGAEGRTLGFSRAYFEHVHEYREVRRALARHGGETIVMDGLRRLLTDAVKNEVPGGSASTRDGALPRDAVVRFVVETFISMTHWWSEQSPESKPAEVNAIFRRLTLPALASAENRKPAT